MREYPEEVRRRALGWLRFVPKFTWAGKLRPTAELLREAGRECRWYGVSIGQCGIGFLIAWKVVDDA